MRKIRTLVLLEQNRFDHCQFVRTKFQCASLFSSSLPALVNAAAPVADAAAESGPADSSPSQC